MFQSYCCVELPWASTAAVVTGALGDASENAGVRSEVGESVAESFLEYAIVFLGNYYLSNDIAQLDQLRNNLISHRKGLCDFFTCRESYSNLLFFCF